MILRALGGLRARFTASRLSTKVLLLSVATTALLLVVLSTRLEAVYGALQGPQRLQEMTSEARSQAGEMNSAITGWERVAAAFAGNPAFSPPATGAGATRALPVLVELAKADPAFRAAALLRPDGTVAVATDPASYSGLAPAATALARATARGRGDPGVSQLVMSARFPAPTLFVAAPVQVGDHAVAVVVVQVDSTSLTSFRLPTAVEADRFEMLVDSDGVVVGYDGPAPAAAMLHVLGSGASPALAAARSAGLYGASIPSMGMQDLAADLGAGGAGNARVRFSPTGRAAEVGYAPVPVMGWKVLVVQDEPVFLAAQGAFTVNIVVTVAIVALVIVALTFAFVRVVERAEIESLHDELTSLPNRRFFRDVLEREISRAGRNHRPFSLVNIDLDHFKAVNDAFGHQQGDSVLTSFARLLASQVRSVDVVARYGGEEFVVLLPDTDKEGAELAAEKIRRAASQMVTSPNRGQTAARSRLTISAGVSSFPEDGSTAENLLRRADQAMYLAKSLGRNQVIGFGSPMPHMAGAGGPDKFNVMVQNANRATVEALAAAIDARDQYTAGHSRRVADVSVLIGRELGLSRHELEQLHLGALLHDVGKIGVPDAVLLKTSRLTPAEFRQVQEHTRIGFEMVRDVEFLRPIGPIILYHHENIDGTGYPERLLDTQIPLPARIVRVADAFDAMVSARTYREAGSVERAMGELVRNSGTQFDTAVVEALRQADAKRRLSAFLPPDAAVAS